MYDYQSDLAKFYMDMAVNGLLDYWGIPLDNLYSYRDTTQTERDAVIESAREQIGVQYVSNGRTPEDGFDCSGLVTYSINAAGIPYVHNGTATMANSPSFRKLGPNEEMVRGDIMLFPGHVGFYDPRLGNNPEVLLSARSGELSKKVMYGDPKWWNNGNYTSYRVRVPCNGAACF